jgi:trk system potassium uptake protein TrkA
MKKQAIVIGLGQFGMALAQSLASRGVDVMAVDAKEERVRTAAAFTADAICFDATNEVALAQTSPQRRDVCVCAIGDESRESSIIVTALLRQMGAPMVVARATDPLHERILRLVGAHQVVNPERAFGERLSTRLMHTGVIDEVPLGEDLLITELQVPESCVGRDLAALELPKKLAITVIAIRKVGSQAVVLPNPKEQLERGDILIVVARPGAVDKFLNRNE